MMELLQFEQNYLTEKLANRHGDRAHYRTIVYTAHPRNVTQVTF